MNEQIMNWINPIHWARRAHVGLSVLALVAVQAMMRSAHAEDLATVAGNVGEQAKGFYTPVLIIFAIIGVFLVGYGLFKLFVRKPGGQDSIGGALGMIVGGALLLVLVAIINIMTQSTVGTDADEGLGRLGG